MHYRVKKAEGGEREAVFGSVNCFLISLKAAVVLIQPKPHLTHSAFTSELQRTEETLYP